jgi:hypothetical protein
LGVCSACQPCGIPIPLNSQAPLGPGGGGTSTSQGHPRTIFRRALERENLVLAEVTAREIGRVTIAEALELTALVARKQPHRYGRFAVRWLCLYLEEHEKATLDDVALLVSNLAISRDPKGPCCGSRDPKESCTSGLTRSRVSRPQRPLARRYGPIVCPEDRAGLP